MTSLLDLIDILPPDRSQDVEDIFACAPGLLFPDDTRIMHGDPDDIIIYKSRRFGDIELTTADPQGETERRLFGHYLWNAGIKLAELVSERDSAWDVRDETVLELGAGVGLSGIVACLAGAEEVVISDYPAAAVLANIRRNAEGAVAKTGHATHNYRVEGHEWNHLDTDFARRCEGHFTRILAADCFWMESQHENLARSMLHFLAFRPGSRVYAVAGFHTGRAKLATFFETADELGLEVEEIYEESVDGVRREWSAVRPDGFEDPVSRKRWLVVARLRRRPK